MRKELSEAEREARATLDGRIAFAAAAFGLACGLLILTDRIGLPLMAAKWLAILIVAITLGLIGVLVRAARISSFHAAGRLVPASWGGLAFAACLAGGGLIFLPPLPTGLSGFSLLLGLALGLLGLFIVSTPLLRKSGAFSLADLIAARFPSGAMRIAAVLVSACVCGLCALAGLEEATRLLGSEIGLGREMAAALSGGVLALALVPGGLAGLTWNAAAAGGMLIAALALPVLLLAAQGAPLPVPVIGAGDAWSHAADRLATFGQFAEGESPLWLALPLALGLMGLAPLLAFSVACRDRASAQFGQAAGAVWLLVIGAGGVLTLALAALGLDLAVIGQRPDRLADVIYQASADGWLTICGQAVNGPAQARTACAALPGFGGVLGAQHLSAAPAFLLFGLAQVQGLGGAYSGLALAGWYGATLALAAAGLQGMATALGHDLAYRLRERSVITSRRLATTRLMLVLSILAGGLCVTHLRLDPRACLGLALGLSAVGLTPLVLLSLWPRAGFVEAALSLLAGLSAAGGVLHFAWRGPAFLEVASQPAQLGLAALVGAMAAVLTGLLVSLRPGASRAPGAAFRDTLLHGQTDALSPDRGA